MVDARRPKGAACHDSRLIAQAHQVFAELSSTIRENTIMSGASLQNLKWRLARAAFWINRFQSLRRAGEVFRGVPPDLILERRLFGQVMACDVSRVGPQRLLYLEGERFISEARLVLSALKKDYVAIDVGANIGYYVLLINKGIGAGGKIIAIEPSPENMPELRRNVERNRLGHKVKIIEAAVGDVVGDAGLLSGINSGVALPKDASYTVRIDKLDNLINEPVDFIKMDIEGYEAKAVDGAMRILSEYRPTLFLEVHPDEISKLSESVALLIAKLRKIYRSVEGFEPGSETGIVQKVLRRYFGFGAVVPIMDLDRYLKVISGIRNARPFWVLCRDA